MKLSEYANTSTSINCKLAVSRTQLFLQFHTFIVDTFSYNFDISNLRLRGKYEQLCISFSRINMSLTV